MEPLFPWNTVILFNKNFEMNTAFHLEANLDQGVLDSDILESSISWSAMCIRGFQLSTLEKVISAALAPRSPGYP